MVSPSLPFTPSRPPARLRLTETTPQLGKGWWDDCDRLLRTALDCRQRGHSDQAPRSQEALSLALQLEHLQGPCLGLLVGPSIPGLGIVPSYGRFC